MSSPMRLDLPAGDRRPQHREVRLAARRREGRRHVVRLALGRGDLDEQHVLGEPALVAGHDRGDAQREALLGEQGVAAVARAVRPDLARVGELHDVLRVVARPVDLGAAVADAVDERVADGVQGAHPRLAGLDEAVDRVAHAGHDAHRQHDVGRVGDLDAELRDRAAERPHRERHDVHRAALHRAVEHVRELLAHLARVAPVVRGARVLLVGRADERAVLDPGDIGGVGASEVAVGAPLGVELDELALGDELLRQHVGLVLRAVAPDDLVGLGECRRSHPPMREGPCRWCHARCERGRMPRCRVRRRRWSSFRALSLWVPVVPEKYVFPECADSGHPGRRFGG